MRDGYRSGKGDSEDHRAAREVMNRAIRRLTILEWLILAGAALAAAVGGGLAALLVRGTLNLPFRFAWPIASFLLLAIPGLVVVVRGRRGRGGGGPPAMGEDKRLLDTGDR